jgi:tetratricopeptide (TPR) repeat protein
MRDEANTALRLLRDSDSIMSDPWIQSAELAVAELFDKGSRVAKKAARSIRGAKLIERSRSELALGLATLEYKNGLKVRDVLKIMDVALIDPTENALAQGVWLADHSGRGFQSRFPTVSFPEEAHEAKALELDERGYFIESEREATLWLQDQPFQVRAALQVVNLNLIHLCNYIKASNVAEASLLLHEDDWHLLNSAALADTLAGKLEAANGKITTFEKRAATDEMRAFSSAARGMWLFYSGRIDEGRDAYKLAISHCKKAKKYDLIPNAIIYWLECEAVCKTVGIADVREVEEALEKAFVKLSTEDRKLLKRVWDSRRIVIEEALSLQVQPKVEGWQTLQLELTRTLEEVPPLTFV